MTFSTKCEVSLTASNAEASLVSERSFSSVPLRRRLTKTRGTRRDPSTLDELPPLLASSASGSRKGSGLYLFCRRLTYLKGRRDRKGHGLVLGSDTCTHVEQTLQN